MTKPTYLRGYLYFGFCDLRVLTYFPLSYRLLSLTTFDNGRSRTSVYTQQWVEDARRRYWVRLSLFYARRTLTRGYGVFRCWVDINGGHDVVEGMCSNAIKVKISATPLGETCF